MDPWTDFAWTECQTFGAPVDHDHNNVIYVNNGTTFRNPDISIPMGQWTTIDLANGSQWLRGQPNLPADVKAICLSGILVTTNTGTATSNMYAFFRAHGSTQPAVAPGLPAHWPDSGPSDPSTFANGTYLMQASAAVGGGARSNACVWVPVNDLKFDYFWWHNNQGAFAQSLNLQAYVR